MIETLDGIARYSYKAYPHQKLFHESRHKHRLLGGAAGPGKTLALIEDHMMACAMFNADEAPQVHTLLVRRTHPKLFDTVITRFREKIPRELYRDFNESKGLVTWHNGSTTKFGSMQHESDVWGYQGQWYKIGYDELTEFTFPQWQNISAWNRCPVSEHCTKDGATNPIGIGAMWVEDVFVRERPCAEMDAGQKAKYNPADYGYFPATYLDNPVYATNKSWIAGLDSYSEAVSQALKMGIWGVAGGYFDGAWDEAENVYVEGSVKLEPWWRRWLGGDWGFDHNSVIHWFCLDDMGVVRIYRELVVNRHTPEMLGDAIVAHSYGVGGKIENYEVFSLSHDAFAQKQDANPIGLRIGAVLQKAGLVAAAPSTKDKPGREQILYDYLKERVTVGQVFNDATGLSEPVQVAKLQISSACENLIRTIPKAPRDEKKREEIAEFLGDDALQSCLVVGTLIETSRGSIPIETVTTHDQVMTRKGWKRVLRSWQTEPAAEVWTLTLSDGRTLTGTGNHPILRGDDFIRLDSLRYGDKIAEWNTNPSCLTASRSAGIPIPSIRATANTSWRAARRASDTFIGACGQRRTARFLPNITSITATETAETTRSRTWNACLESGIFPDTPKARRGSKLPLTYSTCEGPENWLGRKFAPTLKPCASIGSATRSILGDENGFASSASNAADRSEGFRTTVSSAPESARRNSAGMRAWTTSKNCVHGATNSSARINTIGFASVVSLAPAGIAGVYNLEIEDQPEYLANGILVHNCGYGLYAMFGKPRQKPVEVRVAERIAAAGPMSTTSQHIWQMKYEEEEKKKGLPQRLGGGRKRPVWWR